MGLGTDAKLAVRAALCERIDHIAVELPHMKPGSLACAVDDIRRIARNNDLCALEGLARDLENAMAESSGGAVVLPFLEAMSDAVDCDSLEPAMAQSPVASTGQHLHG